MSNIRSWYFNEVRPINPAIIAKAHNMTTAQAEKYFDEAYKGVDPAKKFLSRVSVSFLDDYHLFITTANQQPLWDDFINMYDLGQYIVYTHPEYVYNGYSQYKGYSPKLKYHILKFPKDYVCK